MTEVLSGNIESVTAVTDFFVNKIVGTVVGWITLENFIVVGIVCGVLFFMYVVYVEDVNKRKMWRQKYKEI